MSRPVLSAAVAALVVSLAGCAGTSGSGASAPSSLSPSVVPSSSPGAVIPSSAPPSPSPATAAQTISITYSAGKVSGVAPRVRVKRGSTVVLVVTSDVADEVHLHGYDKHADVSKGGTVRLTFTASLPGVFEVELESLKRRLVLLQIQ